VPPPMQSSDEACARYASSSPRAADEFLNEVLDAFRKIAVAPEAWPPWERDRRYRYFVLARHSYVIYYRREGAETVRVVAVPHSSRRQGYWKGR